MTNNQTTPDASWDYYVTWHSCQYIKAKVDAALKIMNDSENATPELDEEIQNLLIPASDRLILIVEDLEPEERWSKRPA